MPENIAIKHREDLEIIAERFLLVVNRYRGILKQVYLEEASDDKKNKLETKPTELLKIYNDTIVLSSKIIDGIVKETGNVEVLDENIRQLKRESTIEGDNLNNILGQGRAANPRRLDARRSMRTDYFMEIFYIGAILYGSKYIYSFWKCT